MMGISKLRDKGDYVYHASTTGTPLCLSRYLINYRTEDRTRSGFKYYLRWTYWVESNGTNRGILASECFDKPEEALYNAWERCRDEKVKARIMKFILTRAWE